MATLARPADLAILLGVCSEEDEKLLLALQRASDAFAAAVDWPVLESRLEHLVYGDGGKFLRLPARPVSTAEAWIGGSDLADPVEGMLLDSRLGLLRCASGWPDGVPVLVRYTAGWTEEEVPGAIQDVVLERAAHLYEVPGAVKQESTLGMSITYTDASLGVSQRWSDVVDRYMVGAGDWS